MINNIKSREATAIINSLTGGVVPTCGIQHIAVGRSEEIRAVIESLEDVKNGHSIMKFWVGDFGSGKSFMLHLLNTLAMKQKFVVAKADFSPDIRLYSNDGKGLALYSALIDSLSTQTKPEGGALPALLERWIEQVIAKTAMENQLSAIEIRDKRYSPLISENILKVIYGLTDVGGFDFGTALMKYYEGYISGNDELLRNAYKWFKGEYRSRNEARRHLGVREIINDSNFYEMLKNFCKLFVSLGYSGFVVNLDEAVNLYKISTSATRYKNYEKLLFLYNDCFQGRVSNLFINITGTTEFLENPRRGLFSYDALKTRLSGNRFLNSENRDLAQPVIKLSPLNHTEIFVLLKKLKLIFEFKFDLLLQITDNQIRQLMEKLFNKSSIAEFLTPREVIKDFLNVLSIIRQNPEIDLTMFFRDFEIEETGTGELSVQNIEEL